MPAYQMFLHSLNRATGYDRIGDLAELDFGPDHELADRISELPPLEGLPGEQGDLAADVAELVNAMPYSIRHGIREVVRGAIDRGVGVTFAWRAGYDYKLEITESLDGDTTHGGITVVLETRYPDDHHPNQHPEPSS